MCLEARRRTTAPVGVRTVAFTSAGLERRNEIPRPPPFRVGRSIERDRVRKPSVEFAVKRRLILLVLPLSSTAETSQRHCPSARARVKSLTTVPAGLDADEVQATWPS